MKRTIWLLAAWALLLPATAAQAASITINPVTITYCGVPTNIGSITATTTNPGAGNNVTMNALFTLTQPGLLSCITFHWVQVITHANTTLEYPKGTPVGMSVPIIDTPNGGYWFNPGTGYIRTPPNEDNLPWYWTTPEENMAGVGKTVFPSDTISDAPTVAAATFQTWLVAQDSMDPGMTFCVIAGFTWTTGTDNTDGSGNLAIMNPANMPPGSPGAGDITTINTALTNGGFAGWSSMANCDFECCCPEPASLSLLLIGGVFAAGRQHYVRRKRAA